jgi:transposase-like protein
MESEPKRKRRLFSPAERQQLLAAWHSSGESSAKFGRRHGVHASNLIRWAEKAGGQSNFRAQPRVAKSGFVELRPTAQGSAARDEDRVQLEIECPNGLKLRASHRIDVEMLTRLVTTLGGVRSC